MNARRGIRLEFRGRLMLPVCLLALATLLGAVAVSYTHLTLPTSDLV